jgi:hypothetical protein
VGDVVGDEALGDVATDHHVAHAVTVEDRDEGRNVGEFGSVRGESGGTRTALDGLKRGSSLDRVDLPQTSDSL